MRIIARLGEQNAAFYLAAHPDLDRHALAIKEERDHFLGVHSYPSRLSNQTPAAGNGQPRNSGNSFDGSFLTGNSEPANSSSAFDENGMPVVNNSFVGSPATNVMLPGSGHNSSDSMPFSRQILVTIKSEARFEQTIYDGEGFSDLELKLAEQHAGKCCLVAPPEHLAAFCASQPAQQKPPAPLKTTAVSTLLMRIRRIITRRNQMPLPPMSVRSSQIR